MSDDNDTTGLEDEKATDLYRKAVSDGTSTERTPKHDDPLVVESNASNYGASAVTPSHVPGVEEGV